MSYPTPDQLTTLACESASWEDWLAKLHSLSPALSVYVQSVSNQFEKRLTWAGKASNSVEWLEMQGCKSDDEAKALAMIFSESRNLTL